MGFQIATKYTLTGPDGTTVSFNDRTDGNFIGWLTDISGLDGPEWRTGGEDYTEADGGRNFDTYSSRRPIVLEGMLDPAVSTATLNTRIENFQRARLAKRADATLTWTEADGIARRLLLRLQSFRVAKGVPKTFSLGMVSASHLIESAAVTTVTTNTPTANVNATNNGNAVAVPVVKLYGVSANPVDVYIAGTLSVRLAYVIPAGRIATIDFAARTVFDDLGANLYRYVVGASSLWTGIPPGVQACGATSGSRIDVLYRHSWE